MPYPFIIWCRQRTASNTLFDILAPLSDRPIAQGEPFDPNGQTPRRYSHVVNMPNFRQELQRICRDGWVIKHVFERLPSNFNQALAAISTQYGYRHIHLDRRDQYARLMSMGIAEATGAWMVSEKTKATLAGIRHMQRQIKLDVPHLMEWQKIGDKEWRRIKSSLKDLAIVETEHFTTGPNEDRWKVVQRLADFIGVNPDKWTERMPSTGKILFEGGQHSEGVWHLVSNASDLRRELGI